MNLTLSQMLALCGGSSVVAIGVSGWLSRLVSERIVSKWRRDEQSTIEIVRNALTVARVPLESAVKGFQASHDAHQPKRLGAVERLWIEVLRLRDEFSQPIFFCSIFMPGEYESLLKSRKDLLTPIATIDSEVIVAVVKKSKSLECDRPYLGETLWLQFFIYRAFLARLALILSKGVRDCHLQDWRQDDGIRQILSAVLTPETLSLYLEKSEFIVAINLTVNALERSMLEEISRIVSGVRSSFESFENAKHLQDAIASTWPPIDRVGGLRS